MPIIIFEVLALGLFPSHQKMNVMTDIAIKKQISEQIAALDRVTKQALKSRESANQYLKDLGLVNDKREKVEVIKKER